MLLKSYYADSIYRMVHPPTPQIESVYIQTNFAQQGASAIKGKKFAAKDKILIVLEFLEAGIRRPIYAVSTTSIQRVLQVEDAVHKDGKR